MGSLAENALPIWIVGGLLALMAAIVFFSRRNLTSLAAMAVILVATLALTFVERMIVTDREQIEIGLYATMDAIEANDTRSVLAWIDQGAADLRSDAEALMSIVQVERANVAGSVRIELDPNDSAQGSSRFRGFLNGVLRKGGVRISYFDDVELYWTKQSGRWLIEDYDVYWKGRKIDAVDSARGNRPVGSN